MILYFQKLSKLQSRENFDCGVAPLNDFLKKSALQNQEKNISKTFVLFDQKDSKTILGFYSISSGHIDLSLLPNAERKRLPKHPVPIARIGRLAVSAKEQGKGYGAIILADALKRAKHANEIIGLFAVVVEAKDKQAVAFYLKHGFEQFTDLSHCLFIPIKNIP